MDHRPVNRMFQSAQLVDLTLNKAAEALSPLQCAGSTVTHEHLSKCTKTKNTMYIVPHAAIRHEGVRCGTGGPDEYLIIVPGEQLSDPRTAFINNLGPLYTILSANARASNAFKVLQGIDPVQVGFEYGAPRVCGGVERFPQNTVFFFIVPSPDDLDLNFGFAYLGVNEVGMISVREDEQICLYKQTRNLGPGQPPFATPTPTPSPGRNLDMPSNLYDLNDPAEIGTCFPVTTPEPFVPPSAQPSPSTPSSPSFIPSSSPEFTPLQATSYTPTPFGTMTPSPITSSQGGIPPTPSMSVTPSGVPESPGEGDETPGHIGICFPSSARVELENGLVTQMSHLSVGDRIHVGYGLYSDIFLFTHHIDDIYATFINVSVESNMSIVLSPNHYIPVSGRLRAAYDLKKGDVITLGSGKPVSVLFIAHVFMRGLHNPQTLDGHIVVDGILASTYTKTIDPIVATSLLAPLRWVYNLNVLRSILSSIFIEGSDFFAAWLPGGPAR